MANRVEAALREIEKSLNALGAKYAVVGGLAVSARARPRMTADVDVAVAVENDAAAESLVARLIERGYRVRATIEHKPSGRMATVRLDPPGKRTRGVIVDLLFAASGIEAAIVAGATRCVFGSLSAPTASIGHLIAMKVLSMGPNRPDDEGDLLALFAEANRADLAIANDALSRIAKAGLSGRRDLKKALAKMQRRFKRR